MMLFDEKGDIYEVIVPIDDFFDMLTPETYKSIYSVNYYFFLIECLNRFNDDVKHQSKMSALEDKYYIRVRESVYNFRSHKFANMVNLSEIEQQVIRDLAKKMLILSTFSPN